MLCLYVSMGKAQLVAKLYFRAYYTFPLFHVFTGKNVTFWSYGIIRAWIYKCRNIWDRFYYVAWWYSWGFDQLFWWFDYFVLLYPCDILIFYSYIWLNILAKICLSVICTPRNVYGLNKDKILPTHPIGISVINPSSQSSGLFKHLSPVLKESV